MKNLTVAEQDEAEMMFKLMEYDVLNDWEDQFVLSVSERFDVLHDLTENQFEKLKEVFKNAAERDPY
jgi:hypothetical protein